VRLADGELVWRFRGAPEERLVGAFEGIESAWPIHGNVLVQDGVVYFAAGRSSFLDDGILAYSLDARTGTVLSEQRLATPYSMEVDIGRDQSADTGLLSDLLVSHGGSIYMRHRNLFPDEKEKASGGPLRSTGGLLDDSWFSRTRWHLDDRAFAEYFVFDTRSIYGVRARDSASDNGGFFKPAARGYELLAADLSPSAAGDDGQAKKAAGKKKRSLRKRWSIRVPLRVTSLVLAGETLFAAGTPDTIDPDEPWAAYEGKRGGALLAIAGDDGRVLAEYKLDSPAVLDGLSAAHGRLYVSSADGKVLCFAGR
jgi:outer membrane protein assembly factor BamB